MAEMRIALLGKFYWGAAGSQAATETTNVENVKLSLNPATASRTRRTKTYTMTKVLSLDPELTFDVYDEASDSFLSAILTAATAKSRIAMFPTDTRTSGVGLDADFYITGCDRDETDLTKYNVTAKPTDEVRDPAWSTKS